METGARRPLSPSLIVLAVLAVLLTPLVAAAAVAGHGPAGPAQTQDWSSICYWHEPGAVAPVLPAEQAVALETAAIPAQSGQNPRDVTVVSRSYFDTSLLLVTTTSATTGEQSTRVFSDADLDAAYVPEDDDLGHHDPHDDPWEGFNRAMFQFNDTLYFWIFDPAATGYAILVPQPARIGIANAFENIKFPIRFVNNLLQGKVENSFRELLKFLVNTIFGLGGIVESSRDHAYLNPPKQDLDKTFRTWGIESGNYVVWPIFGPYSVRHTFGDIGDTFLWPPTYLRPWYVPTLVWIGEKTNALSLRLGDYEAMKEASLDPYVALRDLYMQYRNRPDFDPYYDDPSKKPDEPEFMPLREGVK